MTDTQIVFWFQRKHVIGHEQHISHHKSESVPQLGVFCHVMQPLRSLFVSFIVQQIWNNTNVYQI